MLVYVKDRKKECELYLRIPNTDIELTEEFIYMFATPEMGLTVMLDFEKEDYKTTAKYVCNSKQYNYWGLALSRLQSFLNNDVKQLQLTENYFENKKKIIFFKNFNRICNERKTTPTAVVKALGLSTSKLTLWKNGSIPKEKYLVMIAEHLGVSVAQLFGG